MLRRIGIDASNIHFGGGVTHLVELLRAAKPQESGFGEVILWSCSATLNGLEERPWLRKAHESMLDSALPMRFYWQRVMLDHLARRNKCNVIFVPGGSYGGSFRPFLTMSQNLLPFEWREARRFGLSWMLLKMMMLRRAQRRTLLRADGLVFLTEYARRVVMGNARQLYRVSAVIPHGISQHFFLQPKAPKDMDHYSSLQPFRILYVSTVDVYKHQWHVAEAVAGLKQTGLPVQLDLVGPSYLPALKRLRKTLQRLDPLKEFIHYRGMVPHEEIPVCYHEADLFVFASSCENMPNILLEAMAAGLPIACSNRGPMIEVLGDAGVYFDPEKPVEIAGSIRKLIEDPIVRAEKAEAAYERAKAFTWERCARETFDFIAKVVKAS